MTQATDRAISPMNAVANAMVQLHKEQFGRGPTSARASLSNADTLVCVLEDALLPAERKLVKLGDPQRVREARLAFQAATSAEFVDTLERILQRKVRAFGSAVDTEANVVFETFMLEPDGSSEDPES